MRQVILLFAFAVLALSTNIAPCYDADNGYSAAVLNAKAANELRVTIAELERANNKGTTQLIEYGRGLLDVTNEYNIWTAIAWEDEIIITYHCSAVNNQLCHDIVNTARDTGVIAIVSWRTFGNYFRHYYNQDGDYIRTEGAEYRASQRPWYGVDGWIEYDFFDSAEIGFSYVMSEPAFSIISDFGWDQPRICRLPDYSINETPCDTQGANYASVFQSVFNVGSVIPLNLVLTSVSDVLAMGTLLYENSAAPPLWLAYAHLDGNTIVAVWDCTVDPTLCTGNYHYVINAVSFLIYGDNSWHSYFPDGTPIPRQVTTYIARSRPWFATEGWVTYDFLDLVTGAVSGQGTSHARLSASGEAVIVGDYDKLQRDCYPDFSMAPCIGDSRDNSAVRNVLRLAKRDYSRFESTHQALEIAHDIVRFTGDTAFWIGVAWDNDLITVQNCDLIGPSELCNQAEGNFIVDVVSPDLFLDYNIRSFDLAGNSLSRPYAVEYLASRRPWYRYDGWVAYNFVNTITNEESFSLGYSFATIANDGHATILADYYVPEDQEGISCDVDLMESPCPEEEVIGAQTTVMDVIVVESVRMGPSDLNSAFAIANDLIASAEYGYWVAAAYGDEVILVWACSLRNDYCGEANLNSSDWVISIVSTIFFGDRHWRSFDQDRNEIQRAADEEEYNPFEMSWYYTNGWRTFHRNTIDGEIEREDAYTFVAPINTGYGVVASDFLDSADSCDIPAPASTLVISQFLFTFFVLYFFM